ncbi:MAG: glycosyltransferase family 39 protein [Blastocatellia bacterium]|nr:glycosyltransferase family 39 protein [Blastocatellia bacterium]
MACLSWWLAWKYQDEFIVDWDGFDYSVYTVQHLPSALGLSRALFLGYNYLLWEAAHRWFGVGQEHVYLVIRYGVMAQTGPAIIGMYALCKELTADRLAATLGALLLAGSPLFIVYSGRSMSEIPAFLMIGWALWWMLRSLRRGRVGGFLLAAALVGASANIREFAVFYLPFIPIAARVHGFKWRVGIAGMALAALCAVSGMLFWAWFDTDNYLFAVKNWYRLSAAERRIHPVTTKNLRFFIDFAFHCSAVSVVLTPLAMVWAAWAQPRRETRTVFWLGAFGLLADLVLIANHDLAVNPRYLLTGLLGLAPLCGWCLCQLIHRMRLRALPMLLGLLVLTQGSYNYAARELYQQQWASRAARDYFDKIRELPWNAGFIVGARSPLIHFYAGIGARPYWRTVSSGANWPDGGIHDAIQALFYAGRIVYVDFDPELWQSGAREKNRETDEIEMIKREYRLQPVRGSLHRILHRLPPASELRE